MEYQPGNFNWMEESFNVIEILTYDYKQLCLYAGGYGWNIFKTHTYGAPFVETKSNIYDKIRDHMWNNHTDNSFHYSMNIMEYIAKKNWVSLIKYTKKYPNWYCFS